MPRRPDVSDVVAFGSFLLHGVLRAGARSEETGELLGEEMTSDPDRVTAVAMETSVFVEFLVDQSSLYNNEGE